MFESKKLPPSSTDTPSSTATQVSRNRKVYLNLEVPEAGKPTHMNSYCTNEVFSAQYTVVNFIPKNIYRQFKRAANLFFLLMAVVGTIPTFANGPPGLSVLPIATVIVLTAIKDGFEDWRRHVSDRLSNNRVVRVLTNFTNLNMVKPLKLRSNSFTYRIKKALGISQKTEIPGFWLDSNLYPSNPNAQIESREVQIKSIRVGDVVLLNSGDPVPADLLILATSHEESLCYADSKDLDGETSLKPRYALKEIGKLSNYTEISKLKIIAECSPPTENMFVFNCNVSIFDENDNVSEHPANLKNVLLRDMIIRNTDWVLGLVVYTGAQTKVILNTGPPKFKRSRIEKSMNRMIIVNFVVLFLISLAISIVGTILYVNTDRHIGNNLYLNGTYSPFNYFIILFISSLFMLQNVIPISLYISIELVKLAHAFFIYQDINMYYEKKDLTCSAKNWSISDDLGQIEYVFSDKTGTLTNNVMTFRMCSINGVVYGKQLPGDELDVQKSMNAASNVAENQRLLSSATDLIQTLNQDSLPDRPSILVNNDALKKQMMQDYQTAVKNVFQPRYFSLDKTDDENMQSVYSFVDPKLFCQMKPDLNKNAKYLELPRWSSVGAQEEMIDLFMTQLAVNHTVLIDKEKQKKAKLKEQGFSSKKSQAKNKAESQITSSTPIDNSLSYSAESPDECALVLAARNFGYTFIGKKGDVSMVDVHGQALEYMVLASIDFDSVRKRMSTVVRRPHPYNDVVVFCKGADTVMLDLLCPADPTNKDQMTMRKTTFEQIDKFASSGLRTLVLAYKIISDEECDIFLERYRSALSYIGEDRQEALDAACASIENNFELTGCTAIEDRLQEKVSDCIAALRSAGVHVWVLTGDKMETAINIGFAANLLTKNMELWTLDGKQSDDDTLTNFWLISKLVHETRPGFRERNGELISLHPKETKLLGRISYQIKKASKYIIYLGRNRKNKMSQADIATQSIKHLQRHPDIDETAIAHSVVHEEMGGNQEHSSLRRKSHVPLDAQNALIIDGRALKIILANEESKQELVNLAPLFTSVICTRVSPLQKAEVVKLVKDGLNTITLAIGDGANDVSMIQAANVGVAIVGEEGMQASNAADYSFGRFHFLQNLLLVHGLYDYLRVSETVLTFFYKNNIWALAPLWYTFYSRFSSNYFFNLLYVQCYNLIFTSLPVIVLGWMDKPFNYKTAMIYTNAYKAGIKNEYFGYKRFVIYSIEGVAQSVAIFMLMTYTGGQFSEFIQSNGKLWSGFDLSSGVAVAIVIVASLFVVLNVWQMSWLFYFSIAFSIGTVLLLTGLVGYFPSLGAFGIAASLLSSLNFWLSLILVVVTTLLPRYVYSYVSKGVKPSDLEIIKEIKVLHKPWYGQIYTEKTEHEA